MKTTIDLSHKVWPDPVAFDRASAQDLERVADLARADEREACAKVCEELAEKEWADNERCAAAIRARGQA
jgi:hypothetical protein